jgi:transcriptional regulator of arginine metabolism
MNTTSRGQALRRQAEILRLVRGGAVGSQRELGRLLRRRGFAAAQPTLSRDLADLGLARTPSGYAVPPALALLAPGARRAGALDRVLAEAALSVRAAGSLVVVRTPPAGADPMARALDEAALAEVVGTIAGDDTVFVAAASAAAARRLERCLRRPLARRRPDARAQG